VKEFCRYYIDIFLVETVLSTGVPRCEIEGSSCQSDMSPSPRLIPITSLTDTTDEGVAPWGILKSRLLETVITRCQSKSLHLRCHEDRPAYFPRENKQKNDHRRHRATHSIRLPISQQPKSNPSGPKTLNPPANHSHCSPPAAAPRAPPPPPPPSPSPSPDPPPHPHRPRRPRPGPGSSPARGCTPSTAGT
jgi:hypothetical protein